MCEKCKLFNKGEVDILTSNKKITPFVSVRLVEDGLKVSKLKAKYCTECGEPLTEPKPLTLEELKERDGKPVYFKHMLGEWKWDGWHIWENNLICLNNLNKTWHAFDREPRKGGE